MFALRHNQTGELMTVTVVGSGDAEFCVGYEASLSRHGNMVWVTQTREVAERVRDSSTDWYNASLDSPENSFEGQLEVVELEVK